MQTPEPVRGIGPGPTNGATRPWGEVEFRRLLEHLPAGAYTCDPDGLITYYNRRAVEVWGRSPKLNDPVDRFCGSFKLFATDGSPLRHDQCWMALALRTGRGFNREEIVVERPDGTRLTVLAHANPIRDESGRLLGAVNVLVDISDRKRDEEARALLSAIVESSEDAIVSKTLEGRILTWNLAAERLFGYPADEAVGRPVTLLIPPDRLDEERMILDRIRRGERLERYETVRVTRDGQLIDVSLTISPIRDADGRVVGASKIAHDITERKRAEEQLRRSERELTDFFENAPVGLHWVGPDGVILRANRAELELLGYAAEEYVGRHIADFHADADAICDILRRLQAGEELHDYEARLRCKDGSVRHVLISSNALWEDGRFIHTRCFTRDVTDRKRNEAALAGQKRVLELLVQGAPLPDVLDSLCEIIEGQSQQGLIATVLLMDEDGRRLRSVAGRRAPAEYARAVDGLAIGPCAGSCGTAAYRGEPVVVTDIAADPLWADYRDLALGHGLRACWSTPLLSSQGKVLGTFAVYSPTPRGPSPDETRLVDILTRTAGVAVERRRAEESLRVADRRKDEFLATLAHELRNPLAPVRNAVELLRMQVPSAPGTEWALRVIDRQMQQMTRLIDDLMDVSRISRDKLELKRERVELAEVVRVAMETGRPLIEAAGHEFTVTVPPEPVWLDADPVRLAQCVANLLTNAAKYTDRGGRVWLTAERQGSDAVVTVRDTGIGVPAEHLSRVFDMFAQVERSQDRAQGGLGIGLHLVKRLVAMHGGSVSAHSDGPGKGSEFAIRLPLPMLDGEKGGGGEGKAKAAEGSPSGLKVLIVDDNRDAAASLGMLLRIAGHDVRTAHDGLEAVGAADGFRPDVVLLDIGLPRLNGYDVARRLRQQPWGQQAVLIAVTGWGQDGDRQRSKEAGFDHHMVKPVDPSALLDLLTTLARTAATRPDRLAPQPA